MNIPDNVNETVDQHETASSGETSSSEPAVNVNNFNIPAFVTQLHDCSSSAKSPTQAQSNDDLNTNELSLLMSNSFGKMPNNESSDGILDLNTIDYEISSLFAEIEVDDVSTHTTFNYDFLSETEEILKEMANIDCIKTEIRNEVMAIKESSSSAYKDDNYQSFANIDYDQYGKINESSATWFDCTENANFNWNINYLDCQYLPYGQIDDNFYSQMNNL